MALSDEQTRGQGLKRVIQKAARVVGLHVGRYPPVDSLAYHIKTVLREAPPPGTALTFPGRWRRSTPSG